MMCIGMSDPGLLVLPTHRLFRGPTGLDASQLASKLRGMFDLRDSGTGAATANEVWEEIETADAEEGIAVVTPPT
jgi:hypothetical protein